MPRSELIRSPDREQRKATALKGPSDEAERAPCWAVRLPCGLCSPCPPRDTATFNFKHHPDCTDVNLLSLEQAKPKPRSDFSLPVEALTDPGFELPGVPSAGKGVGLGERVCRRFCTVEAGWLGQLQ